VSLAGSISRHRRRAGTMIKYVAWLVLFTLVTSAINVLALNDAIGMCRVTTDLRVIQPTSDGGVQITSLVGTSFPLTTLEDPSNGGTAIRKRAAGAETDTVGVLLVKESYGWPFRCYEKWKIVVDRNPRDRDLIHSVVRFWTREGKVPSSFDCDRQRHVQWNLIAIVGDLIVANVLFLSTLGLCYLVGYWNWRMSKHRPWQCRCGYPRATYYDTCPECGRREP
jgi:hypothetical protein